MVSAEPEPTAWVSSLRWRGAGEALAKPQKANERATAIKRRERWGSLANTRRRFGREECEDILEPEREEGFKEGQYEEVVTSSGESGMGL